MLINSDTASRGASAGPGVFGLSALRGLVASINHLLGQHPNAAQRLAAHAGALIRLGIDGPAPATNLGQGALPQPELWFTVTDDGRLEPGTRADADVQLLVKPSVAAGTALLTQGPSGLSSHLRVEGNVLLAGLIGELMQDLSWDYEDDLARVIGDVPARRVGEAVEAGRNLFERFAQEVTAQAGRSASSEQSPVMSRAAFDALDESLRALDKRITELERRLTR